MAEKLSQRFIDSLENPGRFFDSSCTGLYYRVMPNGARLWIYRRTVRGQRREISIGRRDVSLSSARAFASRLRSMNDDEFLAEIARMRSPEDRPREKVRTFAQVADAYLEWCLEVHNFDDGSHAQFVARRRLSYANEAFGHVPITGLKCEHVAQLATSLWDRFETMNRTVRIVKSVFNWAKARGWAVGDNPADTTGELRYLLPRNKPIKRNHGAIPLRRIPEFCAALAGMDSHGARCFLFSILTATRSDTARHARWEDFDLENGVWNVPATDLKVQGNGNLVVPLAPRVVTMLKAWKAEPDAGEITLFVAPRGRVLTNTVFSALLRRLNEFMGKPFYDEEQSKKLGQQVRPTQHGIARACFRTWATSDEYGNDQRFSAEVAELCLHHKIDRRFNGAYERGTYMLRRRELMTAWADFCLSLVNDQNEVSA